MNKNDFLEFIVPMMEEIADLKDNISQLKVRIKILEASQ